MTDEEEDRQVRRGLGDPAREKTVAEHPVSQRDLDELRQSIEELNRNLAEMKARKDLP